MARRTRAELLQLYADNTAGNISAADLRDLVDTMLEGQVDERVLSADGGTLGWRHITGGMLDNDVQNGLVTDFRISGRTATIVVAGSGTNPSITLPVDRDTIPNAANVLSAINAMSTSQRQTARGTLSAYGIVNYGPVANDTILSTITTAASSDLQSAIFIASGAFSTTNARVAQTDRTIAIGDVFWWGITPSDSTYRWHKILPAATYAQSGGGGGGLNQAQVDARVAALVENFAEVGNAALIPRNKMNWGGNSSQYVNGAGALVTFPTIPVIQTATEGRRGTVELASLEETAAATDTQKAITPDGLTYIIPRMTAANRSTSATTLYVLARTIAADAGGSERGQWIEITLPSAAPPPAAHTRYIGVATGTTITDAALTSGATSTNDTDDTFNAPTWASGDRYLFFGVPDNTGDVTGVVQTGAQLGNVPVERIAGTRDLSGTDFKVWRTTDAWPSGTLGGRELTIQQASS